MNAITTPMQVELSLVSAEQFERFVALRDRALKEATP